MQAPVRMRLASTHLPTHPTSAQLIREYAAHQEKKNLRPGTIVRGRRLLRAVSRWLEDHDHPPLDELTPQRIEDWLATCRLSPRSRYTYLSALTAFFDWLGPRGPGSNPAGALVRPRLPRLVPRPIDDDDLSFAVHAAPPRMRAWLSLAAYQGLRCCEIADQRREDVLDTRTPPLIVVTGKGGHQRVIPLHHETMAALRTAGMPRSSGLLFPELGDVVHPANVVSREIIRYFDTLGIQSSAHRLRHWFATQLYRQCHDLRLVQELMGHADPKTTAIYAAWDRGDAFQVISSLTIGTPPAPPTTRTPDAWTDRP